MGVCDDFIALQGDDGDGGDSDGFIDWVAVIFTGAPEHVIFRKEKDVYVDGKAEEHCNSPNKIEAMVALGIHSWLS